MTGIGFGWIGLEAIGQQPTEVVAEELAQPFTDPLGPEFAEYFKRAGCCANEPALIFSHPVVRATDGSRRCSVGH